jgi:hypothetical protein
MVPEVHAQAHQLVGLGQSSTASVVPTLMSAFSSTSNPMVGLTGDGLSISMYGEDDLSDIFDLPLGP